MAALVPRETPLPQFAPRPSRDRSARRARTGGRNRPAVTETAPVPAEIVKGEPAPDMPLPRQRPEIVLASAEPEPDPTRRTASEIEAALNGASKAKRASGDQVEKLIASARDADIDLRAMQIPLPISAPRPERLAGPKIEMASLPVPETTREEILSDTPTISASLAPIPKNRASTGARDRSDLRHRRRDDREGAAPEHAHRIHISGPAVELVPADEIDPSRFGSWTTTKLSVTDHGGLTERPVFVQNALREAPTAVYTQGFAKSEMPDSRRFSGKAVTFLTVAKFAGGKGGDGQPLTLRLPITN
jgi:hypothetical protein